MITTGTIEEIATRRLDIDRKVFYLDVLRNDRGTMLKITECSNGRRNRLMLPIEAVDDFLDAVEEIAGEPER